MSTSCRCPKCGAIFSLEELKAAELAKKKKENSYAAEQFRELRKMGFIRSIANRIMRTVGPGKAVECTEWTKAAWEKTRSYCEHNVFLYPKKRPVYRRHGPAQTEG